MKMPPHRRTRKLFEINGYVYSTPYCLVVKEQRALRDLVVSDFDFRRLRKGRYREDLAFGQ